MRLIDVLDIVNQIEKSAFLKILDGFCSDLRKSKPKIDQILAEGEGQLKNVDDENIVNLYYLLIHKYKSHIQEKIKFSDYQLDILVDILIRDGNSIMSRDWFLKLYNKELSKLDSNIKNFDSQLSQKTNVMDLQRKRDYVVYKNCVKTGYENDLIRNREMHLSWEEKSILFTLATNLDLSNEEVRWIMHIIIPLQKYKIDDLINELKDKGIIFFNRKTNTIFVPDEINWLLREINGIELPNKYLRRILKNLSDPEINLIAKRHNVDRKLSRAKKITSIIDHGINVTNLLTDIIFKPGASKTDKNKRLQLLMEKGLEIDTTGFGRSLEERVTNLIKYFNALDKDQTSSLSRDGFNSLLMNLKDTFPYLNKQIKEEFELQDENVMVSEILKNYNIQPRDILYLLTKTDLQKFCRSYQIKSRGNLITNIIQNYRNIDDLFIESFDAIGRRDLKSLHDKGLDIKESGLGIQFEIITKKIFSRLGFNVDEKLRASINKGRQKIDILLNLGNKNLIIVECKTKKDTDYNQYTAVSRQLKSYENLCEKNGYLVSRLLLVANDFSDDFTSECEYDYELNLSLITSRGLAKILEGFKGSRLEEFPVKLLMRDGLLNEDRIVKVLMK
ncbi:MAG: hypothetical protein ACTSUT_00175 [Promethearchaeota archaeon]